MDDKSKIGRETLDGFDCKPSDDPGTILDTSGGGLFLGHGSCGGVGPQRDMLKPGVVIDPDKLPVTFEKEWVDKSFDPDKVPNAYTEAALAVK